MRKSKLHGHSLSLSRGGPYLTKRAGAFEQALRRKRRLAACKFRRLYRRTGRAKYFTASAGLNPPFFRFFSHFLYCTIPAAAFQESNAEIGPARVFPAKIISAAANVLRGGFVLAVQSTAQPAENRPRRFSAADETAGLKSADSQVHQLYTRLWRLPGFIRKKFFVSIDKPLRRYYTIHSM